MSKSDIAVSVKGVSKSYTIAHNQEKHVTLAEAALARLKNPFYRPQTETFWALKDVSFDIKKGDVVGIIGRNGAGKSTLLKILSRITEPTAGRIDLYGRVGSLLEVGTGFHPELTGRENVFLNGAILGMTKSEIRRQFDAVVDFAGVEKFLDTPVKRYSSGMYVRLAFAVAAHLGNEILIIDEVLAVGDAEFQKKCLGKMEDVSRTGRTVLFVSHNMAAVTTLCSRAIYLTKGLINSIGPTNQVISEYIQSGKQHSGEMRFSHDDIRAGNEKIRMLAVRIVSGGQITADVEISQDVDIEVDFETLVPGLRVSTSVHLLDHVGTCILATFNAPSAIPVPDPWFNKPHPLGRFRAVCRFPANFMNDGNYGISAFLVTDSGTIEVLQHEVINFTVHETGEMRKEYNGGWIGMIRPRIAWETTQLDTPSLGRTSLPATAKVGL